jgi:predicted RNA-binding protein with PIN domain
MSLHYILDGYNVIKRIPELARLDLRSGRAALYHLIQSRSLQGSLRNKLTIVFDGKEGIGSGNEGSGAKVIFSKGRSADEEIKEIIALAPRPATIVLVSDDRQLQLDCRALGAKRMTVGEFMGRAGGKARARPPAESTSLSPSEEYKINAELRKIWLKK